jgi:predicted lactoylglutathione lyase
METRLIWANLVSGNIPRTIKFYTALGFKKIDNSENEEAVSFTFGKNNFIIYFFTPQRLSKPVNGSLSIPQNANEIIFSLSADSKADVDKWVDLVKSAEGTIFSEPQEYEKGYTFGFADPDHHKFNVLYWPGM